MRKVLLASSALVAVAAVSSASADVSVSAYYEFGYTSVSDNVSSDVRPSGDNDKMFSDSEVHFKFDTTSDSGLNFGAVFETEGTTSASGTDEASMYISTAEMGTLTLGENDTASDSFQTWTPGTRNMATQADAAGAKTAADAAVANGLSQYATDSQFVDSTRITYVTPDLGGMKLGFSYTDGDNATSGKNADSSIGFSYATDLAGASVTLKASQRSNGESGDDAVDASAFGVSVGYGDISLGASSVTVETKGSSAYKTTTTGYGIGYSVNSDLSVAAAMSNSADDTSKNELETTSIGLSYTIASGLNFSVAFNSSAYDEDGGTSNDMTTDELRASIQANF